MLSTFEFVILGLATGAITGITGASGVLVVVPILTTILDLPFKTVLGTSLLVDVIASLAVTYAYARTAHVDAKKAVWILLGALLGAQAGSFFVAGVSKILIALVLSLCMAFFGAMMWRNGATRGEPKMLALPERLALHLRRPLPMALIGVLVGLATGVFGAGGGLTIFIALYSLLRLPLKTAVGTSTFVMLLTALSGVAGYARYGRLDLETGIIIGLAAAVGGAFSSILANRVRDAILARLISAFFIILSIVMFVLKVAIPLNEQFRALS